MEPVRLDQEVRLDGKGQVQVCLEREPRVSRAPRVGLGSPEPLEFSGSPVPLELLGLSLEVHPQVPLASREPAAPLERRVPPVGRDARESKGFRDPLRRQEPWGNRVPQE